MNDKLGTITLMGSGELTESMARVHRALLARAGQPAQAVFLDTPAGFELNADEISARAVEYFQQRFNTALDVATFRSKNRATALEAEEALRKLRRANLIFAGPGSPSYAIKNWRGSAVWDTIVARVMSGAQLVLASAAAISMGCCSVPVYEIYKAGDEIAWIDGLDLLGTFGLKLAIMPHWNNAEGGTYDTRFCFMGEPRLKILEQQLPFDVVILGIDEHTACVLDLPAQQAAVFGAGGVTVRYAGREKHYPSGAMISFDEMRAANLGEAPVAAAAAPAVSTAERAPGLVTTTRYLEQLVRAMEEDSGPDTQRELIDHAHETMHELSQEWRGADTLAATPDSTPLIELLVNLRTQLRAAKQFALADRVREELSGLGIVLEDTPNGTRWSKNE